MRRTLAAVALIILILGFVNELNAQTKKYKPGQSTVGKFPGVKGARFPTLSPDGSLITFTLHGDIWVMPATGGRAKRITMHRAYDVISRFSPDGTTIAFTSNRGHGWDVYTVPVSGGKPKKITHHGLVDMMGNWAPDGQSLLLLSTRSLKYQIWQFNINGGTPKQLTTLGGLDGVMSPDKRYIVYSYGVGDSLRRNYHGTGNWDLYLTDLQSATKVPRQLTNTDFHEFDPYFTSDGKYIYYRAEINGTYEIFKMALDGKSKPVKITNIKNGTGVAELYYEPKNNVLIFAREFYLFKIDLNQKSPKIVHIPVIVNSDVKGNDMISRTYTKGAENADIDPLNKNMAFMLRGDIWVMPVSGGIAQQLTDTTYAENWPRWSPDGKKIAYFAPTEARVGTVIKVNNDIHILDLATKKTTQITKELKDDNFHNWSPDGKHLVFCSDRDGDKDIYLVSTEKPYNVIQLTNAPGSDDDPCFSPDGRHILFDSARTSLVSMSMRKRTACTRSMSSWTGP